MHPYAVILLDADNTLFDFDLAEHKALTLALEGRGIPCTPEVEAVYLEENRALWAAYDRGEIDQADLVTARFARTLERLGRTGDAAALNRDYLARLGEQSDLLPGALDFCAALAPHCTLALCTNGVASVQHGRLARSPLGEFFPHPFISQELGAQKPQPAFFDTVLETLGETDRAQVVMVGDTLGSDVLGGIRAGLDTVWFNPKGLPGRPDIVPTHVADGFPALERLLLGGERTLPAT